MNIKQTEIKKVVSTLASLILMFCIIVLIPGCPNKDEEPENKDIWDIDKDGIPKFVEANYIELGKIYRISKFRSSVGHDYSDGFEQCRSMKHYFEPRSDIDWATVKIYSPVTGTITRVEQEWADTKIEIASKEFPAFRFSIFHVNLSVQLNVDDEVTSGELLGTHTGSQTMSDISVIVNDPTRKGRMISYFETLTDDLFGEYSSRGVNTRDDIIIPKAVRDANPLTCSGETFITTDTLENWVILK
jgi:hypothetical protein